MEATMIMLDNSESAINGDHAPTRWDQQVEAAGLLVERKMQDSAQASVGAGLMAGKRVEILCAPTNNALKVTAYLFGIQVYGQVKLKDAIKTALLAMKNRQNTNQRQRIICMIASQINDSQEDLTSLGKQLKKDSINVDLIICGDQTLPEFQEQRKMVEALMDGLKSSQSTTLWVPSNQAIKDALVSSTIFGDRSSGAAENQPADSGPRAPGDPQIDPNMDPELAMVLEASRKEYEQLMRKQGGGQEKPATQAEPQSKPMEEEEDQDAIAERRAIQLSLEQADKVQQERKKHEQEKKPQGQKKPQAPAAQKPKAGIKPEEAQLTKKHGDFINEFQKMDVEDEDDEQAKLKKKEAEQKKDKK